MTTTDQSLVASLARAQLAFGSIKKSHTNAAYAGSQYADIADVLAVVRPVLAAEGIAVVQPVRVTADGCELVTALLKGEERMESVMPLDVDVKAQALGSSLTYLRRYSLCALVGVHPEGDDDDGNAAQESGAPNRWQGGTRFPSGKPASDKQQKFAAKLMGDVVHMNLHAQYIEDTIGRAAPLEELTTAEMSRLIDKLQDDKKAGRTPDGAVPDDGTEPF